MRELSQNQDWRRSGQVAFALTGSRQAWATASSVPPRRPRREQSQPDSVQDERDCDEPGRLPLEQNDRQAAEVREDEQQQPGDPQTSPETVDPESQYQPAVQQWPARALVREGDQPRPREDRRVGDDRIRRQAVRTVHEAQHRQRGAGGLSDPPLCPSWFRGSASGIYLP